MARSMLTEGSCAEYIEAPKQHKVEQYLHFGKVNSLILLRSKISRALVGCRTEGLAEQEWIAFLS